MVSHDNDSRPPIDTPEDEECLRILLDYQKGRLTLEDAAPQHLAAMQANPGPLHISASPSVRRLLAEVDKLAGGEPMPIEPDPSRHRDGGRDMVDQLEDWILRGLATHPQAREAISISCHFAAATEAVAERLKRWLETHGNHRVQFKSPVEADSDDWIVRAHTPHRVWTAETVGQWVSWIRDAPLDGEASFRGCAF